MSVFVTSAIDGKSYNKSNGAFTRHLHENGLTYQSYYETFVIKCCELCPMCLSSKKFYQKRDEYANTCGNKRCAAKYKHVLDPGLKDRQAASQKSRWSTVDDSARNKMINKRISTNASRYGGNSPMTSSSVRNKVRETNRKAYGVDFPFDSPAIRKKAKETLYSRYAVTVPCKNEEIKQKMVDTNLEKYGVRSTALVPEFMEKKERTNIERYGSRSPFGSRDVIGKIRKDNVARWGTENASQSHLSLDSLKKMDSESWMRSAAKTMTTTEIANMLGSSRCSINRRLARLGISACSMGSSFEMEISQVLSEFTKQLNIIIGTMKVIPSIQLDIYLPEYKLAIECNGDYYHSEKKKNNSTSRGREYHLNKTKLCEEKGIQLIHIWEHDWIKNPELIKRRLLSKLGLNEKVFARKTQVAKLTTQTAAEFLNQHHIQGTCPASLKYGLYDQDELVAVMTLGKSRFSKTYEWELLRYCSTKQVIGGASKLFKHFQRECQPKSVVSYSDKMWNTGDLYRKLGFVHSHVSKPSYYYTKNYYEYENRVAYQKHKLHKKLKHFDPNLTEWENMQANGFDRIWDCGSDVWVWNDKY